MGDAAQWTAVLTHIWENWGLYVCFSGHVDSRVYSSILYCNISCIGYVMFTDVKGWLYAMNWKGRGTKQLSYFVKCDYVLSGDYLCWHSLMHTKDNNENSAISAALDIELDTPQI